MPSFPLATQTAYQDLLESHKVRAVSDLGGAPISKSHGTRGNYWYARQRIGSRVVDRYIGRDTPEIRKRIEKAKHELEVQKALERHCSRLVAQLRAAGLPALSRDTGKILNAMTKVGTFRLGGTLIGTHAFRLYSAELGVSLDGDTVITTQDTDIEAFESIKISISHEVDSVLASILKDLKLSPVINQNCKHKPTRWTMQNGRAIIDFLTPKTLESGDVLALEPPGVYIQALPFLNFLTAEPIPAVGLYRSGVLVQIPRPERYAIHKLIVAQRRTDYLQAKSQKDFAQARNLIRILSEDRPHALREAYETAMNNGPEWKALIEKSLSQNSDIAEIIEGLR